MIVEYARTSTTDQIAGLDAQLRDLKAAGAERVFSEQVSATGDRPRFDEAMRFVRDGDVLIVGKADRLARSTVDLLRIVEDLTKRSVGPVILSLGGTAIDTRTASGELMVTMFGAVAAFERDLMLERQKCGIAAAKLAGKYKGRAPTAARRLALIQRLDAEGVTRTQIVKETKVSIASVYRLLAKSKAVNGEQRI